MSAARKSPSPLLSFTPDEMAREEIMGLVNTLAEALAEFYDAPDASLQERKADACANSRSAKLRKRIDAELALAYKRGADDAKRKGAAS